MKRWIFVLNAIGIILVVFVFVVVLNPCIVYANQTTYKNFTIYHNRPIDSALIPELIAATELIKKSELYSPDVKIEICLQEDSKYPALIETVYSGRAFAVAFYNKVVLMGNNDYKNGYMELGTYKWNLVDILAHEMMHIYEYNALGLFRSNPIARIPDWKWEGYPEYISRQSEGQKNLVENITHLTKTEETVNNGWIFFSDTTGTVIPYYKSWLLVQYCMDIKKMSFKQILADTTQEDVLRNEMIGWYYEKTRGMDL